MGKGRDKRRRNANRKVVVHAAIKRRCATPAKSAGAGFFKAMSSRFTIANPCSKKWTDLPGDGRERYCDACRKSVHAIAEYSREERDQIWRNSCGQVCAFLSGESVPVPRSRRAILAGALLTAISPLMAQAGRVRIRVIDKNGGAIPTAMASLLDAGGKTIREA